MVTATRTEQARQVVAAVADPELPMVTLADLGMIRDVVVDAASVRVDLTPTYSGCPALHEMRADIVRSLRDAGFDDIDVRLVLSPAWTTDWITAAGRQKLQAAGIAPPVPGTQPRSSEPVRLTLSAPRVRCPRCDGTNTERTATFAATACRSLYRCRDCAEPFEYLKAI